MSSGSPMGKAAKVLPLFFAVCIAAAALALPLPGAAQDTERAKIPDASGRDVPNLSGKWVNSSPMIGLKTIDGKSPPLNDKGTALYAVHSAHPDSDPIRLCQLHGEPRLLYTTYPFLILQYAKHVDFIHEPNHIFRLVNFGAELAPDADPVWLGNSSAKWDGDTLVIDSITYNDKTWLDYKGLPHSDQLKTQERYTLAADGKSINGVVVIDDPEYYTKPWSTAFTLKKLSGFSLREFICEDNHKM